eukprot:GFYU01004031.1.p1 GENE.GFYU01004031.1~~GFYU01004031.1.p1  ORF type:complete len:180 (-),score=24.80 GFYU01004031.1:113-652(-)
MSVLTRFTAVVVSIVVIALVTQSLLGARVKCGLGELEDCGPKREWNSQRSLGQGLLHMASDQLSNFFAPLTGLWSSVRTTTQALGQVQRVMMVIGDTVPLLHTPVEVVSAIARLSSYLLVVGTVYRLMFIGLAMFNTVRYVYETALYVVHWGVVAGDSLTRVVRGTFRMAGKGLYLMRG